MTVSPVLQAGRSAKHQTRSAPVSGRIAALDMTKGVLVLLMVVYHSFNYSTDYTLGFKYLPFLPSSFILITGFLISYLSMRTDADRSRNPLRMPLRGLRLVLIFTLLNLAGEAIGRHKLNVDPEGIGYVFDHWFDIYITGNAHAAFVVLLPIAYLLILAPLLIVLDRASRFVVPILAILLISYEAFLAQPDELSANLSLLMAGVAGILLGRTSGRSLGAMGRYWFVALAVYGAYIAIAQAFEQTPIIQLLGACLAVAAVFCCCARAGNKGLLQRRLVTLGKYSLIAYIVQIGLLQVLTRFFGRLQPYGQWFFLQMVAIALVMSVIAEGLEWARTKMKWVDVSYRLMFA